MNTNDLLDNVKEAWLNDVDLQAYCQSIFSKSASVYIGIDDDDPATQENYPIVAMTEVKEVYGHGPVKSWELFFACGIIQETKVTTAGPPKSVVYLGIGQVEKLRELAEQALIKARFAKINFKSETDSLTQYPVFVSFSVASIEKQPNRRRV